MKIMYHERLSEDYQEITLDELKELTDSISKYDVMELEFIDNGTMYFIMRTDIL